MIKKDTIFKWNHESKYSCKRIEQSIVEAPTLRSLDFDKEFILYTFTFDTSYAPATHSHPKE